jgi:prolyl-tRNA synthetase
MRTRLFLRTAEFLWQEGHTAHATKAEAVEESEKMMNVYADFAENFMAIPVIKGLKTETERFAGAEETYCIEALMQDGKALQAGTSHFLGQNFAKAFDVKFANAEGKQEHVWGTSWGVSTRLMGALVMTHSDDQGLVLPPSLAPIQVVIVPIYKTEEQFDEISAVANGLVLEFKKLNISVKFDNRTTQKPGFKFAEWELKGVPVRIAVGPKDIENGTFEVARRDTLSKEVVLKDGIVAYISGLLLQIQKDLFEKALNYRNTHITKVNSFEEFESVLNSKGGFVSAHWDGTAATEEKIKEMTKATIRCIPLDRVNEAGSCVFTGDPSIGRVLFAKAY